MRVLEDFGERTGRNGEVIDEFLDAYVMIQPEAGDDVILLAMAICDARLGRKAPDWRKALRECKPEGKPN